MAGRVRTRPGRPASMPSATGPATLAAITGVNSAPAVSAGRCSPLRREAGTQVPRPGRRCPGCQGPGRPRRRSPQPARPQPAGGAATATARQAQPILRRDHGHTAPRAVQSAQLASRGDRRAFAAARRAPAAARRGRAGRLPPAPRPARPGPSVILPGADSRQRPGTAGDQRRVRKLERIGTGAGLVSAPRGLRAPIRSPHGVPRWPWPRIRGTPDEPSTPARHPPARRPVYARWRLRGGPCRGRHRDVTAARWSLPCLPGRHRVLVGTAEVRPDTGDRSARCRHPVLFRPGPPSRASILLRWFAPHDEAAARAAGVLGHQPLCTRPPSPSAGPSARPGRGGQMVSGRLRRRTGSSRARTRCRVPVPCWPGRKPRRAISPSSGPSGSPEPATPAVRRRPSWRPAWRGPRRGARP